MKSAKESMKLQFILPAVMPQREFITTQPNNNHQISAVDMHRENLDGTELIRYPLITEQQINFQN